MITLDAIDGEYEVSLITTEFCRYTPWKRVINKFIMKKGRLSIHETIASQAVKLRSTYFQMDAWLLF